MKVLGLSLRTSDDIDEKIVARMHVRFSGSRSLER
jgi:hypothetical protein